MQLIKELFVTDIDEKAKNDLSGINNVRRAVRAVVWLDTQIALLDLPKSKFHELPGGGIDEGETVEAALHREMAEETGYCIKDFEQVGMTLEYKEHINRLQINYVYTAHATGERKALALTEEELKEGHNIEWMAIEEAIDCLQNDKPETVSGKFGVLRELAILKYISQIRS